MSIVTLNKDVEIDIEYEIGGEDGYVNIDKEVGVNIDMDDVEKIIDSLSVKDIRRVVELLAATKDGLSAMEKYIGDDNDAD
jgi:hypothetical protein